MLFSSSQQQHGGDTITGHRKQGAKFDKHTKRHRPDPLACVPIGGKRGTNVRFTHPPTVACDYDISQFQQVSDITRFQKTFHATDSAVDHNILPSFCAGLVATCKGGAGPCSRLMSTGQDGTMCRAWATREPVRSDTTKRDICRAHGSLDECRCLNRRENEIYQAVEGSMQMPDQCWFAPCQDFKNQLIPREMQTQDGCPPSCMVEYNVVKGLDEELVDSLLGCHVQSKPPYPGHRAPTHTKATYRTQRATYPAVATKSNALVILLIVVLIIFALWYRTKRS